MVVCSFNNWYEIKLCVQTVHLGQEFIPATLTPVICNYPLVKPQSLKNEYTLWELCIYQLTLKGLNLQKVKFEFHYTPLLSNGWLPKNKCRLSRAHIMNSVDRVTVVTSEVKESVFSSKQAPSDSNLSRQYIKALGWMCMSDFACVWSLLS